MWSPARAGGSGRPARRVGGAQKEYRNENCTVLGGAWSTNCVSVIRPKLLDLTLRLGNPRFSMSKRFENAASKRTRDCPANGTLLPSVIENTFVLGPMSDPIVALPNRPILF